MAEFVSKQTPRGGAVTSAEDVPSIVQASEEAQELRESGMGWLPAGKQHAQHGLQGDAQLAAQHVNPASEEAKELRETGAVPLLHGEPGGLGRPSDKPLQIEGEGPEVLMTPLVEQDPVKRRHGVAEAMRDTDVQYAQSTADAMKND